MFSCQLIQGMKRQANQGYEQNFIEKFKPGETYGDFEQNMTALSG